MKKSRLLLAVVPMLATTVVVSCNNQPSFHLQCTRMAQVYREMLADMLDTTPYDGKTASQIVNELNLAPERICDIDTYYDRDIQYVDYETRDDFWPAWHHLMEAADIAACGYKEKNQAKIDIAKKLVYYWVFNNYRSSNWWFNEIGCNRHLTNAAMFVFDKLNDKGQAALLGKLRQSSLYYRPTLETHTGANLIDFAEITLKNSILSENSNEFKAVNRRMEEEITDENVEGFQKDGSFFQHGKQVQTCSSYGKSLIRMGNFFHVVGASAYQVNTEKLAIVSRCITEGFASMTHNGYLNYSSMAREICRENIMDTHYAPNTFPQMKNYLSIPGLPNKNEVQKYVDSITNRTSAFSGMKYFNVAKMVAVNTNGLYISFKGTNDELTNTECVNEENKLGLNLSYSTNTCVMDHGNEYDDISALWDYAYIPGTTSIQMSEKEHVMGTNYDQNLEESDKMIRDIAEGVDETAKYYNDGAYQKTLPKANEINGYVYADGYDEANQIAWFMQRSNHHDENEFTVTCVATPEGMVLLGADLNYTGSITGEYFSGAATRKLHTTLEQCFYKGSHELKDNNKTLIHGNAKYHSLDDKTITADHHMVDGHWMRNKKAVEGADKPVKGDVFLATIDTNASKKYAYSIQHKDSTKDFALVYNFDDDKVQEVITPNGKHVILAYEDTEYSGMQLTKGQVVIK
ncbi:MAG: hypothetical protein MJ206_03375 [Bacilli bacterium]|nr:hypothetical protein [Bacilli bacterium]